VERGEILWTPDRDDTAAHRFAAEHGFAGDYAGLQRWSVDDLEGFWGAIAERVRWRTPPERILADRYARGELDDDEYRRRLNTLHHV
jgi:acetoacetyl-CoA synthetase